MLNNTLIQLVPNKTAEIQGISVSILRLDLIHPVVSGNKIFKLKYYLEAALNEKKQRLITFGGAYSNHLVATAFAAQQNGLKALGYVRGEAPEKLSDTLSDCLNYGMELKFVPRLDYDALQLDAIMRENTDAVVIPYGGHGRLGALGAREILAFETAQNFDTIMASCGSGTMGAGLLAALNNKQKLFLFSAMKNNFSIEAEIKSVLLKEEYLNKSFEINHHYHFGGFAKKDDHLLEFMNAFYKETTIPTDFVYTGKLVYGMNDMIQKQLIPRGSNILLIHSGGLQGNRSLKNKELIF
ncbi:MAG: 1-aminocyclopropane-1-carboxylate deaminase/D-cysteine desulfhydrase [Chitinophagaceae bacterium]|jgi:1-aminocyclopropane-1-carboxylate deaminase